ncbi:hypothetical protein ACFQ73_01750 [Amycolatopsis japonica]|uniref:hypothetical protein n=1 Tax=Amycolatopsis TaxID=1813 RepID=UPI000F784A3D|nr:hypothetical protein [Amycolatopsis sp. WAC 04197]RSN43445.1 hypothetical protein DMC64_22680 [Amycolatopsis sp. WAC 04197]
MTEPSQVGSEQAPPRTVGPLWVISLFLGLSEVTVAIATTQATGWIQAMLAIFAVAFPVLVSSVFFILLWRNNKVLYAPREFADGTTVHDFVDAMSGNTRRSASIVESTFQSLTTRLEAHLEALGTTEAQRTEIIDWVGNAARSAVVTVHLSVFSQDPRSMQVPIDESTTVTELLDAVYFAIFDKVSNFSYSKTWLLRDTTTGHLFDHIGRPYARRHLGTDRDFRLLAEVGIEPGSTLSAVRLPPSGLD